jgi:NAD(P)-dependent dehydrogenase (short-subunit alcohol dehydrogenase family)
MSDTIGAGDTTQVQDPPPQTQDRQPGLEHEMAPLPIAESEDPGCGRLRGKIALITGGDSGIGRATAIAFAKEGADVAISYLDEHRDAEATRDRLHELGRRCLLIPGDVGRRSHCVETVERTVQELGGLHILVNNAAEQHTASDLRQISEEQLERTFRTNFFGYFFMTQAALDHLGEGCTIINCTSVTAYRGSPDLIDYASTKGAILAFTRSLSTAVVDRGIRVNAVAPGPIWTPLIPASFDEDKVEEFGKSTPMGRPGQPGEVATCFVFLASDESSYMTGQVLHPNGGEIVNA